jgi:hypothetical protein
MKCQFSPNRGSIKREEKFIGTHMNRILMTQDRKRGMGTHMKGMDADT